MHAGASAFWLSYCMVPHPRSCLGTSVLCGPQARPRSYACTGPRPRPRPLIMACPDQQKILPPPQRAVPASLWPAQTPPSTRIYRMHPVHGPGRAQPGQGAERVSSARARARVGPGRGTSLPDGHGSGHLVCTRSGATSPILPGPPSVCTSSGTCPIRPGPSG